MTTHIWRRGLAGLGLVGCSLLAQAQGPQPAGTQHATRSGMAFTELEESLLKAARDRRIDGVAALLSDNFQMVLAQDGGGIVPREDWLEAIAQPGAGAWVVSQLTSHDFGDVAVVSLVLRPAPKRAGAGPLAVVDTWQKAGGGWRLALRHVASASGARKAIPGDAPTRAVIQKY